LQLARKLPPAFGHDGADKTVERWYMGTSPCSSALSVARTLSEEALVMLFPVCNAWTRTALLQVAPHHLPTTQAEDDDEPLIDYDLGDPVG
jgi:hypothetical protein